MRQFLAFLFLAPYVMFASLASGPVTAAVTIPSLPLKSVPSGGEHVIRINDNRSGKAYTWTQKLFPTATACVQALGNTADVLKALADENAPDVAMDKVDPEFEQDLSEFVVALYRQTREFPNLSVTCLPFEPKGQPL